MAQSPSKVPHSASTFVQGSDAAGDVFNGLVNITSVAVQGNQLVAQGVLNGTLTTADGTATAITNQAVNLRGLQCPQRSRKTGQ